MEYFVNEGNKIGYMPTQFGSTGAIIEKKLVAGANIKKGQVVFVSGDMTVSPTTAAAKGVLGVAMFDANLGEPVSVEAEGLFELATTGVINAGDLVESGTAGTVIKAGDTPTRVIGVAISTATNNKAYIKFSL